MPPQPPIERLPKDYEQWEDLLQDACAEGLQVSDKAGGLTQDETARNELWRKRVQLVSIFLPTKCISDIPSSFRFYPSLRYLRLKFWYEELTMSLLG